MNQWSNWQDRLAGAKLPIHEGVDNVDSGFYRIRRKDKATGKQHYVAAAFWREGDTIFWHGSAARSLGLVTRRGATHITWLRHSGARAITSGV